MHIWGTAHLFILVLATVSWPAIFLMTRARRASPTSGWISGRGVKCSWQDEKKEAVFLCCSKLCPINSLASFLIICLVITSWMKVLASGRNSHIYIGKVRRNYCYTLWWSWDLKCRSILINNDLSNIEKQEFINCEESVFFPECFPTVLVTYLLRKAKIMSPTLFFTIAVGSSRGSLTSLNVPVKANLG